VKKLRWFRGGSAADPRRAQEHTPIRGTDEVPRNCIVNGGGERNAQKAHGREKEGERSGEPTVQLCEGSWEPNIKVGTLALARARKPTQENVWRAGRARSARGCHLGGPAPIREICADV